MDWTAIAAISGALALIGGFFLWVVTAIVKNAITEAAEMSTTKIAVMETKMDQIEETVRDTKVYAHQTRHDLANFVGELQLSIVRLQRDTDRK